MTALNIRTLGLLCAFSVACGEDAPPPISDAGGTDTTTDAASGSVTFDVVVANASTAQPISASGVFNTPVGAAAPGPALPGSAYSFQFHAGPGSRLSFATMLVHSNDWFFAPQPAGIELFDAVGAAISGDITSEIRLYDSGTEVDQEPGTGADQAPRQAGPNTGAADADTNVRAANDTFAVLPAALSDLIEVTIAADADKLFTVTVTNVSDTASFQTPFAPGVFAVHNDDDALFSVGGAAVTGLEALAEDGDPSGMIADVETRTGLTTPISPGAWALSDGSRVIFTVGQPDTGAGLEAIAEDGSPATLVATIGETAGAFNTPTGAADPAPVFPGGSYSFTVTATPGQSLALATMLIQSNDWFYGADGTDLELFDASGAPNTITAAELALYDAGTEIDEAPGAGPNQAPRQAGPNTGAVDSDTNVRAVPGVGEGFVTVTITPQS